MISLTLMSLVTSVKDYVEITHKLIEFEPLKNYTELGSLFTYFIVSVGNAIKNIFSFSLLKDIWSIPIIIPDVASAMISEISVLDGYFHNAFTFLETNIAPGVAVSNNPGFVILEKFFIGLINSFFLFLPTSTSHLITLRRFVMQGLEAGYFAGLGTLAGNFLWLTSIILGWRFFVIPWLSFDIFRYLLGFILIVKYIWDSSKERRMVLEDLSKWKIFLLNFLLALTEQTCIYPFISNLSFGPEASVLEGFPVDNYSQFLLVHGGYLLGILIGSFSLLQFTCWFWENPAFSIYIWITTKSATKISTSSYYKILNFFFLYCTMLCAIASIPYYGLDYTITNPIGLVPQDRILDQKKSQSDMDKLIPETAFLGVNPTDKNSRIRDGVHARRERWKQRLIKYQAYDASLYDQGVYDFLTIEDLNYGFDRFWLRRKMRNHQIRFRLFPGPWMRSLKKQLNQPANLTNKEENTSKSATGPRVEFFRILFEQFYHPNFHDKIRTEGLNTEKNNIQKMLTNNTNTGLPYPASFQPENQEAKQPISSTVNGIDSDIYTALKPTLTTTSLLNPVVSMPKQLKSGLIYEHSALRKFVRNFNTRLNLKLLNQKVANALTLGSAVNGPSDVAGLPKGGTNVKLSPLGKTVYSKRWKSLFSKLQPLTKTSNFESYLTFRNVSKNILLTDKNASFKLANINQKLSQQDIKLLTDLGTMQSKGALSSNKSSVVRVNAANTNTQLVLLRPLSFYLQKEQAFKRKLRYYGATTMRKLSVGNQAPYFKTLMKRGFYYYKPSLRLKKTFYVASMRRGFRKKSRKQKNLIYTGDQNNVKVMVTSSLEQNKFESITNNALVSQSDLTPNRSSYSVLNKRASRYRHQIYKDVIQHWYYTPFNRLAMKFDIDAFINRQPKSHYLTKNEERLLHIKRFLLSEHYDTLRWYTYMEHYRTMKTNIGGTKSFASRVYNQQFQGTFKKIRHLFAITPSQEDLSILKFDQPLYNQTADYGKQFGMSVYLHEELLNDTTLLKNSSITTPDLQGVLSTVANSNQMPDNLINSQTNLGNDTLSSENFATKDLTTQATYMIADHYLNKNNLNAVNKEILNNKALTNMIDINKENSSLIYSELFVKLIKECKRQVYDQTFLKNYISHRIEKRDQRNQEQIKELNKRLDKLKTWLNYQSQAESVTPTNTKQNSGVVTFDNVKGSTISTGMQKALNDSIFISKEVNPLYSNKPLVKVQASTLKYKQRSFEYNIKTEETIKTKINLLKASLSAEKSSLFKTTYLTNFKNVMTNSIDTCKKTLVAQFKVLTIRPEKNLEWWRKKQRAITKRKNARKRDRFKKQMAGVTANIEKAVNKAKLEKANLYKTLYGNYEISDLMMANPGVKLTDSNLLRKKQDISTVPSFTDTDFTGSNLWQNFFARKFRKKMSSKGRRYKSLSFGRYLTATRKPKMVGSNDLINDEKDGKVEGLTKIDGVLSPTGFFLNKNEKQQRLNLLTENSKSENNNTTDIISIQNIKQSLKASQINKRSRLAWKKAKRHKFNTSQSKYKKRRIQSKGKLRVMSKKFKKLQATQELRKWWWNSFLPRYYNNITLKNETSLIENNTFKPLSKGDLINTQKTTIKLQPPLLNSTNLSEFNTSDKLLNSEQILVKNDKGLSDNLVYNVGVAANLNINTTSLPFYAGWDESLRKFVVTNRLLSRRDTGLEIKNEKQDNTTSPTQFTNAPIQGLNEGSFLYWQTDMPFNAYTIDQFIATNQSFYAPIGWRRFEFRHSILKAWYTNYKDNNAKVTDNNVILSAKNVRKMLNNSSNSSLSLKVKKDNMFNKRAMARRIKKRYKLLKQTPSQLMYSPTGPLLTEILPSHYISVFDQQYRFPRNRYIRRNLLKTTKKTTLLALLDSSNQTGAGAQKEFTLRKRVKPRRKYHRKRYIKKEGLIFPRRTKFTLDSSFDDDNLRWRPSSKTKQKRNFVDRSKNKANKRVKANPLRLRQLRRREFQQIIKPTQRYQPRNGGFTWPGDYLRLESVEMPKLKNYTQLDNNKNSSKKTSLKQKITVQPVGIMPRKYLIEKHNILVLKKKLEKAHASHRLANAVKEYKFLTQNKI